MKAIQTGYSGYRFRSRCEARWAVYFNSLGIEFEYEPEGFELPSGRYLPDFFLPQVNCFAEVKGSEGFSEHEIGKCKELSVMTGNNVILLDGPPKMRSYICFCYEGLLCGERDYESFDLVVGNAKIEEGRFYHQPNGGLGIEDIGDIQARKIDSDYFTDEQKAVYKSRGARFEHGEKPSV